MRDARRQSIARVVAFAHLHRTWRSTVGWESALGARRVDPRSRAERGRVRRRARFSDDRAGSIDRSVDLRRRRMPRGVRSDALYAPRARSSRSSNAILTDTHTKPRDRARALARSAHRNTRLLLDARATASRASDGFVSCYLSARSEPCRFIFVSDQMLANTMSPPLAFFPSPPARSRPSFASSASASARLAARLGE